VINYRSSQIGPFVKGPGFRGSLSHIDVSKYGANHFTIEQVKEVQALAMKEVLAKVGRRR
jgi:predicted lipoprotein